MTRFAADQSYRSALRGAGDENESQTVKKVEPTIQDGAGVLRREIGHHREEQVLSSEDALEEMLGNSQLFAQLSID